jgi:hypothetical protein
MSRSQTTNQILTNLILNLTITSRKIIAPVIKIDKTYIKRLKMIFLKMIA